MELLIIISIGYIIGSIPFALIIGKVFYKTDIRLSGSGNLGGTNAGRTLGKKAGFSVIVLDILKSFIAMQIASLIISSFNFNVSPIYAGLACVIGHCYPLFAGFKGGKGVACAAGFILALNPYLFLIAVIIFLINLKIQHMVSLSVLISVYLLFIITFIFKAFYDYQIVLGILCLFLSYTHRSNIKRII
ncbi:MAG: glycerol-3-phosphate 1-O-acyltransferase PlsY, partial [Bacilli bacterium]